jgi:hypothetical protein
MITNNMLFPWKIFPSIPAIPWNIKNTSPTNPQKIHQNPSTMNHKKQHKSKTFACSYSKALCSRKWAKMYKIINKNRDYFFTCNY